MEDIQLRLPISHPCEAIAIDAHFEWASGWRLSVWNRHSCEGWEIEQRDIYAGMVTPELADVLESAVHKAVWGACLCIKGASDAAESQPGSVPPG